MSVLNDGKNSLRKFFIAILMLIIHSTIKLSLRRNAMIIMITRTDVIEYADML